MTFLTRNWSIALSVLAVQATLILTATPLLAHDGHGQKAGGDSEQPSADSELAPADYETSPESGPESGAMPKTSPDPAPTSSGGVSTEVSPNPATAIDGNSTLANATGRINLGLGELSFALLLAGPFLLKLIKWRLRK